MSEQPDGTTKIKRAKRSNDARFPVARIKKLIQADEEVGKVAQATPVLVSRALELFLEQFVNELIKDSNSRSTTKISAHTLKRVINTVPTLDFLSDLVESIPDPIEQPKEDDDDYGNNDNDNKKKKTKGKTTNTKIKKTSTNKIERTTQEGVRSSGRKTKSTKFHGELDSDQDDEDDNDDNDDNDEEQEEDDDDNYDE